MKKRVADTEMEMARSSSKTLFVITVFLLLSMICGLVFFVLYDKGLIAFNSEVSESSKVSSKKDKNSDKNISKDDNSIEVNIDDINVNKLFEIVKITGNTCDGYDTKSSVSVNDMSDKCKFSLASHLYLDDIHVAANGVQYVYEDSVKNAYEFLFGYKTYKSVESIPYIVGLNLNYNAQYKYYFYEGVYDEVGTPITKYEKIISAKRDEDMLYITSATLFYEAINSVLCKDVECENVVENMNNEPSYPDYYSLYVDHNKDKLNQYTFKFKMDDAGFYNYVGFERTNE